MYDLLFLGWTGAEEQKAKPGDPDANMQCFKCTSEYSWDDCIDWEETDCFGDQNRCGKIFWKEGGLESYTRDCQTKEFCESKSICKGKDKCSVSCCDTDKCNTGAGGVAIKASSMLILATAAIMPLVVLFR